MVDVAEIEKLAEIAQQMPERDEKWLELWSQIREMVEEYKRQENPARDAVIAELVADGYEIIGFGISAVRAERNGVKVTVNYR